MDIRKFDLDQVKECIENEGYILDHTEFEFAADGAFKYVGFYNNHHKFLIGFESENGSTDSPLYMITTVHVGLNASGGLSADYSGCTLFEGSYDDAMDFVEKTCN